MWLCCIGDGSVAALTESSPFGGLGHDSAWAPLPVMRLTWRPGFMADGHARSAPEANGLVQYDCVVGKAECAVCLQVGFFGGWQKGLHALALSDHHLCSKLVEPCCCRPLTPARERCLLLSSSACIARVLLHPEIYLLFPVLLFRASTI